MQPQSIDENARNTGGGIIQGTDLTLPLFVDPATGRLLIEIQPITPVGTIISRNLNIDENTKNIGGAVTDNATQTITPLTCDLIVNLPCLRIET